MATSGGRCADLLWPVMVAHVSLNQRVQGSSPCAPTNDFSRLALSFSTIPGPALCCGPLADPPRVSLLGWPTSDGARSRAMFCVSEAQAAVIRTAFEQRGELSAVVELRRYFRALIATRWLESASALLLAGNRCWYDIRKEGSDSRRNASVCGPTKPRRLTCPRPPRPPYAAASDHRRRRFSSARRPRVFAGPGHPASPRMSRPDRARHSGTWRRPGAGAIQRAAISSEYARRTGIRCQSGPAGKDFALTACARLACANRHVMLSAR
jgi:hypothetical protein